MPLDLLAQKQNSFIAIAPDAETTEAVALDQITRWSEPTLQLARPHRYGVVVYMGAAPGTLNLPARAACHSGWSVIAYNNSEQELTLLPPAGDKIVTETNNTIVLPPKGWAKLVSGGRNVEGDGNWIGIQGTAATTNNDTGAHTHADLQAEIAAIKTQLANITPGPHEHDANYAPLDHTHDGLTPGPHEHDANYAPIAHDHAGAFSPADHTHDGLTPGPHEHDANYAPIAHDHAGAFSPADHTHDGLTPGPHEHDANYAPLAHDHAGAFAPADHAHAAQDQALTDLEAKVDAHDHPGAFAAADHDHVGLTPGPHEHDANYAPLAHDHAGTFSPADHVHATQDQALTDLEAKVDAHAHDANYAPVDHDHTGLVPGPHEHDAAYAKTDHIHVELQPLRDELNAIKEELDELKRDDPSNPGRIKQLEARVQVAEARFDEFQLKSAKGQPDGYAALGSDGKVTYPQLPIASSIRDARSPEDPAGTSRLVDAHVLDSHAQRRNELNWSTFAFPNDLSDSTLGLTSTIVLARERGGPDNMLAAWEVTAAAGNLLWSREFQTSALQDGKTYRAEMWVRLQVAVEIAVALFSMGENNDVDDVFTTGAPFVPTRLWQKISTIMVYDGTFRVAEVAINMVAAGTETIVLDLAGMEIFDESVEASARVSEIEQQMRTLPPAENARSYFNVDVPSMAFRAAERVAGWRDTLNRTVFPDPHFWAEWALTNARVEQVARGTSETRVIMGPGNATWVSYGLRGTETLLTPASLQRTLTTAQIPPGEYMIAFHLGGQINGSARAVTMNLDTGEGDPITVDKDIPDLPAAPWALVEQVVAVGANGLTISIEWNTRNTERLVILWPQIDQFTPEVSDEEKQLRKGAAVPFIRGFSPRDIQEIASIVAESVAAKRDALTRGVFGDPVAFSDWTFDGLGVEFAESPVDPPIQNAYDKSRFVVARAGSTVQMSKEVSLGQSGVQVNVTISLAILLEPLNTFRGPVQMTFVSGGTQLGAATIRGPVAGWRTLTLQLSLDATQVTGTLAIVTRGDEGDALRLYDPRASRLVI